MEQLAYQAAGEQVELDLLPGVELLEPGQRPLHLAAADLLRPPGQRRDGRPRGVALADDGQGRLDLRVDDPLRGGLLRAPSGEVALDDLAEAVKVDQGDPGDVAGVTLDVAGDGDVEDAQGTLPAQALQPDHVVDAEHRLALAGRADHHVELGGDVVDGVEGDRGAAQLRGQHRRRLAAAGHHEHPGAVSNQSPRRDRAHLAGAEQQHTGALEAAKGPPGVLDGGGADASGAPAQPGLGAHPLSHRHRAAHDEVEPGIEGARLAGAAMGGLELAEDLSLADHHAVQPGGDPEHVLHGVTAGARLEVLGDAAGPRRIEVSGQARHHLAAELAVRRDQVELAAIAGAEHRRRAQTAVADQVAEQGARLALRHRGALANRERSGAMADPRDDQLHQPASPAAAVTDSSSASRSASASRPSRSNASSRGSASAAARSRSS